MADGHAVRVLIADEYPIYRLGLRHLLEGQPGLEVVSDVSSGEEALERARETHPDVVLLDVRIRGMNGIEVARKLKEELPEAGVIIMAGADDDTDVFDAIQAGVNGYVVKDEDPKVVLQAVMNASQGRAYLPPSIAKRVLDRVARAARGRGRVSMDRERELSEREALILKLIAQGKRNREIAANLGISERTVGNHIAHIYSKLRIKDRAQAITYAVRKGIITL